MTKTYKQRDTSLETLNQMIFKHLEERDWHNNPSRGIAISISLESNELLEHYQWSEDPAGGKEAVGEELADILIYAFQLAQINHIDIAKHITKKLEKAAKKYPAASFKGKSDKETNKAWLEHKIAYKKEGL